LVNLSVDRDMSSTTTFGASTLSRCVEWQQRSSFLGSVLLVKKSLANIPSIRDRINSTTFDTITVGFITPKSFWVEVHSAVLGHGEWQYTIEYFLGTHPPLAPPPHDRCICWTIDWEEYCSHLRTIAMMPSRHAALSRSPRPGILQRRLHPPWSTLPTLSFSFYIELNETSNNPAHHVLAAPYHRRPARPPCRSARLGLKSPRRRRLYSIRLLAARCRANRSPRNTRIEPIAAYASGKHLSLLPILSQLTRPSDRRRKLLQRNGTYLPQSTLIHPQHHRS
jgi:hypothetical protein